MNDAPRGERWHRLEALYHEALRLPAADRVTFVEDACGADVELRHDLEELLAVADEADEFLERGAPDVVDADRTAATPAPLIGHQVGPYQITALIGVGGMGDVYRARDTRLGRDIALKVLREGSTTDPDRLARFEREARAAAALNHPNILAVFDVGSHEGAPYLVCELLEGATLRELLARGGMSIERATDYATQMATALAAAHDKGIVHRDIKPENVFITTDGRVKILDFGVAKLTERHGPASTLLAGRNDATMPGAMIGTVGYMSPEQVRGQSVDHRSDVFSFGAVLYEMVTGRRAFERETPVDTLSAILDEEPPYIGLPVAPRAGRLLQIVRRCLQKSPQGRFESCRDLALVLSEDFGSAVSHPRLHRPHMVTGVLALLAVTAAILWITGVFPARTTAGTIRSVAVLPFESLSRGDDDEYFADGITGALITNLGKISALRVVSRTSVMRYKRTRKPLPDIGVELNVDAVVEGSIERAGNSVRISARLVRASTDELLWGDTYGRDIRDVLLLQDEVARAVADEIRVALTPEERAGLARAKAVDPEAYLLYLRGRFLWDRRTEESIQRAIIYFNQAIARDPNYAAAYSGLADCYLSLGFSFDVGSLAPSEAIPKAKEAAIKALRQDDSLAEAHNSLAYAKLNYDWDWTGAEAAFRRSLQLNPGYAQSHHWYAHLLIASGRFEEALAESRRALELDPLSPIMNVHLGWHHIFARQYGLALDQLGKTVELDANYGLAYWYRGLAYEQQSRYADALREMRKGAELLKRNVVVAADIGHVHAVAGDASQARTVIRDFQKESARRYISPFEIALIYVGLGDVDRAFQWLERAYHDRSDLLVYLKVDPRLDPIRSDRRFADLIKRVGIPQ